MNGKGKERWEVGKTEMGGSNKSQCANVRKIKKKKIVGKITLQGGDDFFFLL